MIELSFPEKFVWGVATSSHQIEGAFNEDGRGESIWDRFERIPGRIEDGSDASVACDHYHLWREDIQLMKWLGISGYRFSIAWSRVMPNGIDVNPKGLDFYDRLIDGLLCAGIDPFITLYHWDLPQALQDRGGWGSRQIADRFADYVDLVTVRFGDRVKNWMTINEPWCVAYLGHESGEHAPGHRDKAEALRVAHYLLLSHGLATDVICRNVPQSKVGIVLNLVPAVAASESADDRQAAKIFDGWFNRWFLDPIFRGSYPKDVIEYQIAEGRLNDNNMPFLEPGDLERISSKIDFLGLNYYSRVVVKNDGKGFPLVVRVASDEELTDMGWEVYPEGIYKMLERLDREYGIKQIYVTENGAAYPDRIENDERIVDLKRIEFLKQHLEMVKKAIDDGIGVKGYFVWSLYDNFEWAHGYTKRFGLFWVDYTTQKRIPKQSAFWYREVIRSRGLNLFSQKEANDVGK